MSCRFWISLSVPEIFAIKLWSRSKWTQIFHVFSPKLLWTKGPQNFGTCIIKYKNLLITWQSFAAIGQRSSEISWWNQKGKKTSSVKHKSTWNYRSRWPYIECCNIRRVWFLCWVIFFIFLNVLVFTVFDVMLWLTGWLYCWFVSVLLIFSVLSFCSRALQHS